MPTRSLRHSDSTIDRTKSTIRVKDSRGNVVAERNIDDSGQEKTPSPMSLGGGVLAEAARKLREMKTRADSVVERDNNVSKVAQRHEAEGRQMAEERRQRMDDEIRRSRAKRGK